MLSWCKWNSTTKRIGQVQLELREDLIVGTLHRNGINVFTATLPYKSKSCDISEVSKRENFIKNINMKLLQHLEGYYWKGALSLVGGVVLHEY